MRYAPVIVDRLSAAVRLLLKFQEFQHFVVVALLGLEGLELYVLLRTLLPDTFVGQVAVASVDELGVDSV